MHVGILGGTGPAGRGLAARLAATGIEVTLGSRDQARAEGIAAELVESWSGRSLAVRGSDNAGAAAADIVIMATPWDGAVRTVQPLGDQLDGKVLISMASALVKVGQQLQAVTLGRGSVASTVQAAAPGARVAAAFHHLPADDLCDLDHALAADVLVCADDARAKESTMALVEAIEGLRPLDAGRLSQAQAIEAFTAVCISLNIRYKARTFVRMGGI
jgi:NADPH-dependent F420 reductase